CKLSGKSDGGHTVRPVSFYALVHCSSVKRLTFKWSRPSRDKSLVMTTSILPISMSPSIRLDKKPLNFWEKTEH
ncbi:MAG: hypothetical protein K2P08_03000, partial [Oscillospiraceae bacterium]|nr:hypothetical protein [Oscillospiraceae bacterium]